MDPVTARSGALNVPYAATSNGTVVAGVSPSGQINAAMTGGNVGHRHFRHRGWQGRGGIERVDGLEQVAAGLEQRGQFLRLCHRERGQRLSTATAVRTDGADRRHLEPALRLQRRQRHAQFRRAEHYPTRRPATTTWWAPPRRPVKLRPCSASAQAISASRSLPMTAASPPRCS